MVRTIIRIDAEKCNGCGICADVCHENAIRIKNGKAVLLRDDYCDGMGSCLPACPQGAISYETREAMPYNEEAVKAHWAILNQKQVQVSNLNNWPVQLRLAPEESASYDGTHLLIAADCTAYACASFHERFMRGRITMIGCPKLDRTDYTHTIRNILRNNDIRSVSIVRMEVPCCSRLADAVEDAVQTCGKDIPLDVTILSLCKKE